MFRTMRMSVKLSLLVAGMLLLTGLMGFSGLYNLSLARDRLDASLTTMHHSHTPEIDFESAERASGSWAMTGLSVWRQGDEEHWFRAFGHYSETYEKRDGRWLFTSRRVQYTHTSRSPGAIFPPRLND